MQEKPIRVVQISDIHLFADKNKALLGVKTHESLAAVLALLKADKKQPDVILLTGDLSQDETETAYMAVTEYMKDFPVPIYWIPGNHDDLDIMRRILPRYNMANDKQIVFPTWQIILLNSKKPHAVEGFLAEQEIHFLETCLRAYPNHHAMVVFHHHPVPVGCAWLDRLNLTNADVLWQTLAKYPQAKHILFGHVHQQHEGEKNGIKYYSTPSTCIQFKRNSNNFALEKLSQAYRWMDLYEDGTLKTAVCRVQEYIGFFDEHAKGY